jgi:hypothetical protein
LLVYAVQLSGCSRQYRAHRNMNAACFQVRGNAFAARRYMIECRIIRYDTENNIAPGCYFFYGCC